jgi:type I restriction enzyme S subunit
MRYPSMELHAAGVDVLDCEHKTPKASEKGNPYIAIPDIQDGRVMIAQARLISDADVVEWTRRTVPREGDVLVTRRGRVGDTAPIPANLKCAIGQNIVLLRSNGDQLDQTYLRWAARSPQWWSEVDRLLNVGAVFSSLNVKDIARMRIPVPTLGEQRAIAELLDALDDKIAANGRLAATSALLSRAIFEEAIQEEPEEALLSDVTILVTRGVTPSYSEASDTVMVLNQKCVRDQRVTLTAARRTLSSKVREGKILLPNDVLVNSTGQGTLGRVARWTNSERATADSHISIVRFDAAKVNNVVAGHGLLLLQSVIEEMGEGSTGQTELSRSELSRLPIRLPASRKQDDLGGRLSELAQTENSFLHQNLLLTATRDSLLPGLMSGKLRVSDAVTAVEAVG